MNTKFLTVTIALSLIVLLVFEDIHAINKYCPGVLKTTRYIQDTPKLDSVKHHRKLSKKNKLNKDSIRKYKKDTV